jgi:hypothetical protein
MDVAVKQLSSINEDHINEFQREAKLLRKLIPHGETNATLLPKPHQRLPRIFLLLFRKRRIILGDIAASVLNCHVSEIFKVDIHLFLFCYALLIFSSEFCDLGSVRSLLSTYAPVSPRQKYSFCLDCAKGVRSTLFGLMPNK